MEIFDNYLFHASSVGKIMQGVPKPLTVRQQKLYDDLDKRKNGEGKPLTDNLLAQWGDLHTKQKAKCVLTDGVKKILHRYVWEFLANRSSVLQNKFIDKGNISEESSLTLYSNKVDILVLKNQETKSNKYIIGTADIATDKIRDIKSSWNWETFPLTNEEIPSKIYQWQLDSYMWLWGLKESELIYCLVDTPFKLIDDEIRRLDWKYNILDSTGDVRENQDCIDLVVEVVSGHLFSFKKLEEYCHQSTIMNIEWFHDFREIPEEIRLKIFEYKYSQTRINQLKQMITLARKYMNNIAEKMGESAMTLHKLSYSLSNE